MSPFSSVCNLTQCSAVKLVKKVFGKKDVEAALQRLNRLTQDEVRTTAAETLEVIYGLVQNMSVVIDGEQTHSVYNLRSIEDYPL